MKKINIQRDLLSRSEISGKYESYPAERINSEPVNELQFEPLNSSDNAQSEDVPQSTTDKSSAVEEKPKKGRGKTKGNIQEV